MSLLEIASTDRVRRITLNRSEKRNALSSTLCQDLSAAIEEADRAPDIGAVLLAANGPVFCAGMDLAEIRPDLEEEINDAHERLFTIGARIATPIVAAGEGPAQ